MNVEWMDNFNMHFHVFHTFHCLSFLEQNFHHTSDFHRCDERRKEDASDFLFYGYLLFS